MLGIYWMGKFISMYGIMTAVGILAGGCLGCFLVKRNSLSGDCFLMLGAYALGGGLFGAKLLYLLLNFGRIQWERMSESAYLMQLMQGGYVFYGGVLGGAVMLLIGGRIHHLPVLRYAEAAVPCLPAAHAFGRIGCFFASCCYGIPYDGWGSVVYHAPAFAPVEMPLFPVQLLEAFLNFLLAAALTGHVYRRGCTPDSICMYAAGYGVLRFFLEYLRYDVAERGSFLIFSTSQWISIFFVLSAVVFHCVFTKKQVFGEK